MVTVGLVAFVVLMFVGICCTRVSAWHRHEADFWRHIHILDVAGLAPSDAPALLAWARANPPSLASKVMGWRAPHVRRRRVVVGGYQAGRRDV